MKKLFLFLGVAAFLTAMPIQVATAQDCPTHATVGDFDVTYESAVYDGVGSSEFTYCITGLDDLEHALSHWDLELDLDCVSEDNLVSCGPEPCFFQIEDPTTGITGIKWDDLEVDKGETECFTFALEGDWTELIDDVTIGLKAATDVSYGAICGPRCRNCAAVLEVLDLDADPMVNIVIQHNRPPTTIEGLTLTFENRAGATKSFSLGSYELTFGSDLRLQVRLADLYDFQSGSYRATMTMKSMSGWIERSIRFVLPAD